MRHFVRIVIEQHGVMKTLFTIPASRRYHHSERGGLLQHSLEVAHAVDYMIETFEPDMELIQRDIGIVAGLLHDIGKTKLYDSSGNALMARFLVEHDHLNFEVCAPALSWLDRVMPEGAMALRHIWTCASPGARYGVQPKMTFARYVRDADGQSALADNERLAFSRHPDGGLVKGGQNLYWRGRYLQNDTEVN